MIRPWLYNHDPFCMAQVIHKQNCKKHEGRQIFGNKIQGSKFWKYNTEKCLRVEIQWEGEPCFTCTGTEID